MSQKTANNSTKLDLDIYGIEFRLRAPVDEHERLRHAARHVENVMRGLENSQNVSDTARLAIQTAFMITLDYYKLVDDVANRNGSADESIRRVDVLLQRLEESLKSL